MQNYDVVQAQGAVIVGEERMARTQELQPANLINEIWMAKGKIGIVAERMGVVSKTIYNYMNRYPEVKRAADEARVHFDEVLLDTGEMRLQQAVIDGKGWAIRFVLSSKGKERGYDQSQTVEHGGTIDVRSLSNAELEAIIAGDSNGGTGITKTESREGVV